MDLSNSINIISYVCPSRIFIFFWKSTDIIFKRIQWWEGLRNYLLLLNPSYLSYFDEATSIHLHNEFPSNIMWITEFIPRFLLSFHYFYCEDFHTIVESNCRSVIAFFLWLILSFCNTVILNISLHYNRCLQW